MRRRKTVIKGLIARWHRTAWHPGKYRALGDLFERTGCPTHRTLGSVSNPIQTRGRMTGLRSGTTVCAGDEPR